MRRRDFIVALDAVTFRSPARAQQPGTQIVGILNTGSHDPKSSAWAAFLQGMREVGYIEGKNVSFEDKPAEDHYDRLPTLAKSLVDRHVSVIVTLNVVAAHAAKAATSTIPIVFESGIDPVKDGLVASLNHPGANLTPFAAFLFRLFEVTRTRCCSTRGFPSLTPTGRRTVERPVSAKLPRRADRKTGGAGWHRRFIARLCLE